MSWPRGDQSSQEALETVPKVAARHHPQQKYKSGGGPVPTKGLLWLNLVPVKISQGPADRPMATPCRPHPVHIHEPSSPTLAWPTHRSCFVDGQTGPREVRGLPGVTAPKGWRHGPYPLPQHRSPVPTHTTLAPTPRRLLCLEWPSKFRVDGHLLQEAFSDFSPPPAFVAR